MRSTPIIRNGQLSYEQQTTRHTVAVGTPEWQAWLVTASAFTFEHKSGRFTARKESARNGRGGSYWRAYHTYKGTLYRRYLGKAEALTLARLQEVAQHFAQRHQPALLATKLTIPPPGASTLSRPRLIRRLQSARNYRLMLLTAPAGFGKTTLLSEWCAASGEKIAWLSLDEGDNDLIRFWTYFIAALQPSQKRIGKDALALLSSSQPFAMEVLLTQIINDVAASPHPMRIVLDDYHLISDHAIHSALQFFLDHLPANLHVVIASRSALPLSLAGLRARGHVYEMASSELCFTREEATTFLKKHRDLTIPQDIFSLLETRIEGWITGWYLAAIALRDCDDLSSFVAAFAGSHDYIIEYFVEEVLHRQAPQIQHFLLHTSIVERMNASLCEVLTGEQHSQKLLMQLAQANVFITPLDHSRQWYRYHPLFAEALRMFLRDTYPDRIAELHARASWWYASQGLLIEAIDHALAATEYERAAHLIGEVATTISTIWVQRDFYLLRKWLHTLPQALVQTRAQLCILRAWEIFSSVQIDSDSGIQINDVEKWLDVAGHILQSGDAEAQSQTMRGELATISAALAFLKGENRRGEELAHLALDLLPAENMTLRGVAARTLINVHDGYGGTTMSRAVGELLKISRHAKDTNTRLNALYLIAGLEIRRGHLHQAEVICRQAFQLPAVPATAAGAFSLMLGHILLEWNDLDEATKAVMTGMDRCKEHGDPGIVCSGYRTLAHIRQIQGDFSGALQALDTIITIFQTHELLAQSPLRDLWEIEVQSARAHVYLAQGNRAAARHWTQSHWHTCSALPFQLRVRVLRTVAEIALAHQEVDDCLAILADLLPAREHIAYFDDLLALLTLQSLALAAQGNTDQALTILAEALALAEPGGYVRVFVSAGAPMATLLASALNVRESEYPPRLKSISKQYLSKVLAACGTVTPASQQPLDSTSANFTLSDREREVLHLLVEGCSDREIAQQLIIAEGTVKTHLKRIYAKLGVHKRIQAVLRAKEQCLI